MSNGNAGKGGHCREKLGYWGLGTNEWEGKWVRVVQRHWGEKFCQCCYGDSKLWVWFYFLSAFIAFILHISVWLILKIVGGRVNHVVDN